MTTFIITYLISLIILVAIFVLVKNNNEHIETEDYTLLGIGVIPFINTLFIIVFLLLGLYWEYQSRRKEKIEKNKIYKFLHTRNENKIYNTYVKIYEKHN